MEKKILTLMLAVVAGVIIGVVMAVQRTTQPIIIDKLSEISQSVKSIDKLNDILESVKNIETHLASIEGQSNAIIATLKTMSLAAGRAQAPAPQVPTEDFNKIYDLDTAHANIRGNKKASVTIVEFMDIQCPFCQRFHPAVNDVLKAYPKDVNYVLKNFPLPFHPQSRPAAKAALAAGEQGKYFEMLDLLIQNGAALGEDKFKELAKNLGLNVDKFMKDYKDKDSQWEEIIRKDQELAQRADVRGTPTYYINGRKTMARDLDGFKREIDKILGEKKN